MCDLARRIISPPATTTPEKIGPSTYFIEADKNVKANYAPFLSNARRGMIISGAVTDAIYNVPIKSRIKGGSSMANKTARFSLVEDDGLPGPCAYDPRKSGKRIPREIVGQGRVYNCRVPYNVNATGLSIPTKLDENGYWINENDKLVKIPPNVHDDTLGPAYYAAPQTKCYNSERYKGCRWSLSRNKRMGESIDEKTPGPGTYYPETVNKCSKNNNPVDMEYRALARQFSFLPRFLEAQEMISMRENYPAPCDYVPKTSSFQLKPSVSIKPRPFVSASRRFDPPTTKEGDHIIGVERELCIPIGPGSYDVNYSYRDKKTFSMMKAPFGTLDVRRSFMNLNASPGPASYNVLGPITSKLIRQKNRENPLVPFNKTDERALSRPNRDVFYMPSPADYVVEPLWKEKQSADSCQFKSTSKRTTLDIKNTNDANAGTYNITEPFRVNTKRRSHYCGRAAFQQSRKRGPLFPLKFGPAPTEYKIEISLGGRGYYMNTSPRFKEEPETPGPTSYTIHPIVQSSMHKANATYNLRLKEFVLHRRIKLPPEETFARWCKTVNKRKNLRWFYENEMSLPKVKDFIKEEFDESEY